MEDYVIFQDCAVMLARMHATFTLFHKTGGVTISGAIISYPIYERSAGQFQQPTSYSVQNIIDALYNRFNNFEWKEIIL